MSFRKIGPITNYDYRPEIPVTTARLSELDKEINQILNQNIDDRTKAQLYSSTLKRFLTFKKIREEEDLSQHNKFMTDIKDLLKEYRKSKKKKPSVKNTAVTPSKTRAKIKLKTPSKRQLISKKVKVSDPTTSKELKKTPVKDLMESFKSLIPKSKRKLESGHSSSIYLSSGGDQPMSLFPVKSDKDQHWQYYESEYD